MTPARIGTVRFLNTRPLIHGLEHLDGLTLLPAVPAHLAGMLETGEADIALVSLIDAARARTPLAILPVGMIGSDGPTVTVRLFGPGPIDSIREVWADTDSHTSVALCRLLLGRVYGVRPHFRDFNARERMPLGPDAAASPDPGTAILLIGDKVVCDPPDPAVHPTLLDLGEAWKRWTGLPFVYAAWMCRAEEAATPAIALAAALLDRQRRHNAMRLDSIAAAHAPGAGWPPDLAREYLTRSMRYEFGPREREASQRFIDECAALGIAPATRLAWADWREPARQAAGIPASASPDAP